MISFFLLILSLLSQHSVSLIIDLNLKRWSLKIIKKADFDLSQLFRK